MSFHDVGRTSLKSRARRSRRLRDLPAQEKLTPKEAFDQISEALRHHEEGRSVLKEESLIKNSTTVPRYGSNGSISTFSRLNDEIVQFQKMVNELSSIIESDVTTPLDQWRTRTLLKSADSAAVDLENIIEESPWNQKDLAVKSSFSKLKRDFERARKTHQSAVDKYRLKQSAEAALLCSAKSEGPSRQRVNDRREQCGLVTEEKEDYFDRVMREREKETLEINAKIHVVEDIYRELNRLVIDQQEKVDVLEDEIRYARASTELGLEHLERAGADFCGITHKLEIPSQRESPPSVISMEELSWKLPFQTFRHDILEVRNDLVDLVHVSARKLKKLGRGDLIRCGSPTDFDDDALDDMNTELLVKDTRRSEVM